MAAHGPGCVTEQSLHTVSSWSADLASESFVDISPVKDSVDSPAVAGHELWKGKQTRIGSDASSMVLINGEDSLSQPDGEYGKAPILVHINPATPEKHANGPEFSQASEGPFPGTAVCGGPPLSGMGDGSSAIPARNQERADSELLSESLVASAESTPVKDQEQSLSAVTSNPHEDEWSSDMLFRPPDQDTTEQEQKWIVVAQENSAGQEKPLSGSSPLPSTCKAAVLTEDNGISALTENWDQLKLAPADDLWTTKRDGVVRLRMEQTGHGSEPPITVHQLFQQTVQRYGDRPALAVKRDGQWETTSYWQYYQACRAAAKSFLQLGLQPYHGVGILGFNSMEWFISDIGAIMAGGFAVGIYTTNSPEACQYVAENCEANILVVENHGQLTKILQVQDKLPHVKAIIQYHDELEEKRPNLYTWKEFMQLGSHIWDSQLDNIIASQKANQCCTLIYTSGTTGGPKGVMLSHDNLTWQVKSIGKMIEFTEHEEFVSYLPLSHIAAQLMDLWIPIAFGGTTYFAEPDALKGSLINTLREVHPTSFLGMPRVFEKMQEKLKAASAKSSHIQSKVAAWAKGIGLQASYSRMNGSNYVPWGYTLANILVFKRVSAALGLDRCIQCFTGGAPITKDTMEYLRSLNLPLLEMYGMSECTGLHTTSKHSIFRIMSCGKELLGCKTRIDKPDEEGNGEICYWGRHVFMGYLNMKEKTEEAIDEEGWLHSGDIGKHENDFLYITGRIKELTITSGGENIPPVPIDDLVKEKVPISNAMLIGDKRKYLSLSSRSSNETEASCGCKTVQKRD